MMTTQNKDRSPFNDFVARLLAMGFTEPPWPPDTDPQVRERFEKRPFLRFFDTPENLRSAIKWLNTGGSSLDDYSIMVGDYAPDGSSREWGEHDDGHGGTYSFGAIEPNEELLAALASGAEEFTKWFNSRSAFTYELKDEDGEQVSQGVTTVDGKTHVGPRSVN
jgi:hypothetical protein